MTGRRPVVGLAALAAVAALLWPASPTYAASSTALRSPQAEYGRLARPRTVDVRKLPHPARSQGHRAARLLVPNPKAYADGKRAAQDAKKAPKGTPFSAAPALTLPQRGSDLQPATASVQPTRLTSFAGVNKGQLVSAFGADQNAEPPDPQIAAGPDSLLEMVNASGAVWSKSGILTKLFDLNSFYGVPLTNGFFFSDPRVLYDRTSSRFVASGMAFNEAQGGFAYVAMSQTSDPSGSWKVYTVLANNAGVIYDQPKLSVTTDKLVLAWADFSCVQGPCDFQGMETWVIEKSDVVNGVLAPRTAHFGPSRSQFGLIPAVELTTASSAYLLYRQSLSLQVAVIDGTPVAHNVTWVDQPNNASPSADNLPPDAEQPEGAPDLITGDDRLVSAVWRNGYIWATSTVICSFQVQGDPTLRSCMAYTLVPTTTWPPQPVQGGIFGEPFAFVSYPAVSLDAAGNPIFVFTESSIHMYPTVVSLTFPTSGQGLTASPLAVRTGTASYDATGCGGTNRWGDYSGASTDPLDGNQVWVVGEDMATGGDPCNWGTTIGAVRFTPPPKVTGLNPPSGPTAGGTVVTVTGTDFGGATAVLFGNIPASSYVVDSGTQITATSPPAREHDSNSAPVRLVVNTPGGTSDDPYGNVPLFTYNAPTPVISAVSPTNGSTGGGTVLTISGSGFTTARQVGFGNPDAPGSLTRVPASSFISISDSQIVLPTPARPPATVDVVVTTDGGENVAAASDHFTFVSPAGGAPGSVRRVAGSGRCGSAGDNGPAVDAQLCTPLGVVADGQGNVYIADADNNRIRKLGTDGTITTIAGTGAAGFAGDESWAIDAILNHPTHLAMDADRQLFIADSGNQRIRMIDPTGIIHTIAGNGEQGSGGDGGASRAAQLNNPSGLALDPAGRLYVADTGNHRVRRISRFEPRSIEAFAGTGTAGFSGDGGQSTQAELNAPQGLAVSSSFDVYIADTMNGRIRRAQADGRIFTVAGNPTSDFTDQVVATDARLSQPVDVAFRPGTGTLILTGIDGVKEVARDGTLVQIAGGGFFPQPWDDGPAVGMPLPQVAGITFDPAGKLFLSSLGSNEVYRILPPDLPSAPLALSASAGTGSATVSWVAPATGGSPVIRYDVRPFIGATEQPMTVVRGNGSAPPTRVTINGLRHATYTFQVIATTADGSGGASQSNAVAPITAPLQPTAVNALPSDGSAIVSWQPPLDDGGSPITGYTVTSSPPGGLAGTLGKTTTRVPNLTNGSSYTFIIQAINAVGTGESVGVSPVTPFSGGTFHPMAPVRILDTRDGTGGFPRAPLGGNRSLDVPITGTAGIPTTGVSAVVMNVTVTNTMASSYLTLYPTGVTRPTASNLNWTRGGTVPNLVEVAVGRFGRVTVYNAKGSADVIFDVAGWVGVTDNSRGRDGLFNPLAPSRILDTRDGTGHAGVPTRLGPGEVIHVLVGGQGGTPFVGGGVPFPGASAAVLNVTAADGTEPSYLTVYPRDDPRPTASNVNFVGGQAVPNRVIVKLGTGGQVDIYNARGTVSVIVDLAGWFTDPSSTQGGSFFTGITPSRLLDTRDGGGPLGPNESGVLYLTGPGADQISAVVLNVTVANPSQASYLTVWPDGSARPTASDLNFTRGLVVPNLVVVKMGPNAGIDFYNAAGSTDVIVDIVGYYGVAVSAPASLQLSPRTLKRVDRSRE